MRSDTVQSPGHSQALLLNHNAPQLAESHKENDKTTKWECLVIYGIAAEQLRRCVDIKLAQMLAIIKALFVYQLSILAGTFVTKSFFNV